MIEIITWAVSQLFTKAFWYFVVCSLIGVVCFSFRNSFRSEIYKAALDWSKSGKKPVW